MRGEPLRATVHHTDKGLLADVGGYVAGQPGVRGGAGGEDLAANPQALEPTAFALLFLLRRHVNVLGLEGN